MSAFGLSDNNKNLPVVKL